MRFGAWLVVAGLGYAVVQPAYAQYDAPAVVKAVNRAELSSELAGRVTSLPFRMGDTFEKGDVLAGFTRLSQRKSQRSSKQRLSS